MAAMKVHGSKMSTATRRVLVCLYEKELEFELVTVDMIKGEHKQQPFLSLNPFGQVPAFEFGDLKMYESRAISKYIAQEYAEKGTELGCKGKAMPMLLQWMEIEAQKFDPVTSKLIFEIFVKPMLGNATDSAVVEASSDQLGKVLDVYEARLAQSKYLACGCFTMVDMLHLPNIEYLMGSEVKSLFDSRPYVSAWVADIRARPSWRKVCQM